MSVNSRPLENLRLSRRVEFVLKIMGLETIGDVRRLDGDEFLKMPCAGRKGLTEIRKTVRLLDMVEETEQ